MQIKNASFTISYRKECFTVEVTSQQTAGYRRQAIVSVNDGQGKNIFHESMTGRQLFAMETAKKVIRKGIEARRAGRNG
jgi:hypothetical protein